MQGLDSDRLVRHGLSFLGYKVGDRCQTSSVEGGAVFLGPDIRILPHVLGWVMNSSLTEVMG